jgi:hypothetical protein
MATCPPRSIVASGTCVGVDSEFIGACKHIVPDDLQVRSGGRR